MSATMPKGNDMMLGRHLGRLVSGTDRKAKVVPLRNFVSLAERPLPPASDWFTKALSAIRLMLGNDQQGDCVAVTVMKMVAMATAYRPGGKLVVPTTAETLAFYHQVGGPGDNGLYVPDALDFARDKGVRIGGAVHKIEGYVSIDPTDIALIEFALHWLGGLHTACLLPRDWYTKASDSDVWDLTNSPIVGGHSVPFTGRDGERFRLATWAQEPHVTYRAVASGRHFDEMYGVLHRDWYNDAGLDANGVNVDALRAALDAVRNGRDPVIPDDPNPPVPPPVPPTPPTPPTPGGNLTASGFLEALGNRFPVTLTGNVGNADGSPRALNWWAIMGDVAALIRDGQARDWAAVAADVAKLLADLGIVLTAEEREDVTTAMINARGVGQARHK